MSALVAERNSGETHDSHARCDSEEVEEGCDPSDSEEKERPSDSEEKERLRLS